MGFRKYIYYVTYNFNIFLFTTFLTMGLFGLLTVMTFWIIRIREEIVCLRFKHELSEICHYFQHLLLLCFYHLLQHAFLDCSLR